MLEVVVHGIDAVVAGHPAGEQFIEFIEGDGDPIEGFTGPRGREKLADRGSYGGRGTDLNRVRNVVIVTAKIVHPLESKLLGRRTPCAWFSFPRLRGAAGNMLTTGRDQYTLIPPNLALMRRANAAYPNQKPRPRAMHTVVTQSHRRGANGLPLSVSLEGTAPTAVAAGMDALSVSDVRDAGVSRAVVAASAC